MRLVICILMLGACGGDIQTVEEDEDTTPKDEDVDGPVITHEAVDGSQVVGEDVEIEAVVSDEGSDVFVVEVFYTQFTSTVWSSAGLELIDEESGTYAGVIPGGEVNTSGMWYYLYAVDGSNNETYLPEDAPDNQQHAYSFGVSPD